MAQMPHGDADFAPPPTNKGNGLFSRNGGIPLGYWSDRLEGEPPRLDKPVHYTGDRHVTIVGSNGTGKTLRIVTPAIEALRDWTLVIVDPKGNLAAMTEAHRRDVCKNDIIKLNPFKVLDIPSSGFNPIASLEVGDSFPDDALEMAEAIIPVSGNEPHWPQAGQEVLAALIMYVKLVMPKGTLVDVRQLLARDANGWRNLVLGGEDTDLDHYRDWLKAKPEDRHPDYRPPVIHNKKLYPGMLAAAIEHNWPEIGNKVARFASLTPDNKEMQSVLSTALIQTRWIDSVHVSRDLKGPAIDFSTIKDKATTIYLMIPPRRLRTHAAWLRLCIACIIQKIMRDTRKPRTPVMFILDEYYALAEPDNFPVISKNYAMFREYGIKIMQCWQTLAQMQELSPRGYETFIGNAGVNLFFAPQDATTSEYVSRLTGQTTRSFKTTTRGENPNPMMPRGVQLSYSGAEQFIPFPLAMAQDVRNIDPGFSIAFGHHWKGAMQVYTPWPGDVRHLRGIMALNPSSA